MTNVQSKDSEVSGSGIVIAIDGPSGSGKSTVSRAVAAQLDLAYLDTGAMYRAATWWCLDRQIDLANIEEVSRVVRELPLEIDTNPAAPAIAVAGTDVTEAIRESRISRAVSSIATNLAARAELVARQQEYVARGQRGALAPGGIIAEGRDITTVIAPDRSEERRVGKECRSRGSPQQEKNTQRHRTDEVRTLTERERQA